MPNSSAYFGSEWFFNNLPRNHTIHDVVKLLFNMSNSIVEANPGQGVFQNLTLRQRCEDFLIMVTPHEMKEVRNNVSDAVINAKDLPFVKECDTKFGYANIVTDFFGLAKNTHTENKTGNDCSMHLMFGALLLGLVMLLGVGCLFYNYKDRCFRQRAQIAKDSPLLEQGDSINDSSGSERTEQQEFLSSNRL